MGKTILLVDDEVEITDIHQRYLVQAGYQVLVAHDGVEALEIFKRKPIDLIITDIMMPNVDGYEFIEKLRNNKNNTPVIMLTAKDEISDKIVGFDYGADDYMTKPFSNEELLARIKALLRRTKKTVDHKGTFEFEDLKINYSTYEVFRGEK